MSEKFEAPQQFVNNPLSPKDMETKLDEIRRSVGSKMEKWADRIQVSMAFTPKIERIEGETWRESNRTYIVKNGIKQNVSILQEARMPWHCPKCTKPMNHRFDRKFYYLRGWCFDCNVNWEGTLRIEGKWDAFEKRMMRENEKSFLRDKIQQHLDYIRTFKVPQLHFGDGRWETLAELDQFTDLFAELEKDIQVCENRLTAIEREELEEEANATAITE